jgi:hypothetical protein
MKYASGNMIYIPSFMKICSGFRKLFVGDTRAQTQQGDLVEGVDWIYPVAQDRDLWRALVYTVMNLRVLRNVENFWHCNPSLLTASSITDNRRGML